MTKEVMGKNVRLVKALVDFKEENNMMPFGKLLA